MNKQKGFTLAEILITLAIIGVVASLTITSILVKYKEKSQYTQFMKSYNTISKVVQMAQVNNGRPNSWGAPGDDEEFVRRFFTPYLNVLYDCGNNMYDIRCNQGAKKVNGTLNPKTLSGSSANTFSTHGKGKELYLQLKDGSSLVIIPNSYNGALTSVYFIADIDGPEKGDYTGGSDLFKFSLKADNGKLYLATNREYCNEETGATTSCSEGCRSGSSTGWDNESCDSKYKKKCINYGTDSLSCSYVMLQHGKVEH